ncbi:MAG: VWA domain-containing protein [Planctomycetales bacterium]|nr:VWA domain-containing protein [Planctomycetales bacterium]
MKKSSIVKLALAVAGAALLVALAGQLQAAEGAAPQADAPKEAKAEAPAERPHIEMAILLDTSGSMSGLINQARTQLWKIVNEFAVAERDGARPDLRVALYEYGKSTLPASENFVRMIVPLTDDLDKVSEELFALETNGGEEYCGAVIERAVNELDWSKGNRDLKCIFIAGNEPFTQGPVDYKKACHAAANSGITVSTIHCGDHEQGVQTAWADGAKLADGSYMSINQNEVVPDIAAPQDAQLATLNERLNKTYVAYGAKKAREEAQMRQTAQDANAAGANAAANAGRIAFKASALYSNARWDLCDAYCQKQVKLEDLKPEDLPEELRKLKPDELKAHIEKMVAERTQLQEQIKSLADERGKYVADERKKLAADVGNTLDAAVIEAARKQAVRLDFKFEKN